jgi:hypothetical protein
MVIRRIFTRQSLCARASQLVNAQTLSEIFPNNTILLSHPSDWLYKTNFPYVDANVRCAGFSRVTAYRLRAVAKSKMSLKSRPGHQAQGPPASAITFPWGGELFETLFLQPHNQRAGASMSSGEHEE